MLRIPTDMERTLCLTKNPILLEENGVKAIFRSFTHPLLVTNLLNFAVFVKKNGEGFWISPEILITP